MFSRAAPGANIPPAATVCILVLGATRASDLDSLISPRVVGPRSHFTLPRASHIGGSDLRMPCRRPPATHYGGFLMTDLWALIADQVSDRVSGPMKFRIVLQPIMATYLAIRSGLKDAKSGAPPYFWRLLSTPGHRLEIIKDGWKSVGRLFLLAMFLDLIYQIFVQSS